MDIVVQEQASGCQVTLRGALDIYAAASLRDGLLPLLQTHPALDLNLAEVDEIDTAGLQVLMAAKLTAQAQQRSFTLSAHSPAVLEVLELCQLVGFFGDPVVELGAHGAKEVE